MNDALDIYRAAKLVIDQHGDDAVLYTSGRIELLLRDGDIEGAEILLRITKAVEELQRERRPDEAIN